MIEYCVKKDYVAEKDKIVTAKDGNIQDGYNHIDFFYPFLLQQF